VIRSHKKPRFSACCCVTLTLRDQSLRAEDHSGICLMLVQIMPTTYIGLYLLLDYELFSMSRYFPIVSESPLRIQHEAAFSHVQLARHGQTTLNFQRLDGIPSHEELLDHLAGLCLYHGVTVPPDVWLLSPSFTIVCGEIQLGNNRALKDKRQNFAR
jgi:hypothetical protein